MIPALLLMGTPDSKITAGASGGNIGYGDGTAATGSPSAAFGTLAFTPPFFLDQSVAIEYVYTDGSFFYIFTDAALSGTTGINVTLGSETYAFSDATSSSLGSGGTRYRWTMQTAMTNGATYIFRVE